MQALPRAFAAMDLMNPSKSLLGVMGTFSSRMKQTHLPELSTFPPYPSKSETQESMRKIMDVLELAPVSVYVCSRCKGAIPGKRVDYSYYFMSIEFAYLKSSPTAHASAMYSCVLTDASHFSLT